MIKNLSIAIFLLIIFSQNILAQDSPDHWLPIQGQHYQKIEGTPLYQPGIQFYFWAQSPSCYQLELALRQWHLQNPSLNIERIPLVKRPHWRLLAKTWLVAIQLQLGEAFLDQLYQAIHQQSLPLTSTSELEQFLLSQQLDVQEFMTLFNSVAINQQLASIQKTAKTLPISGVPTIIINNQWISDPSMVTTSAQLITVIDHLRGDNGS